MKLAEVKNWKAVHFEDRPILKGDEPFFPTKDWYLLVSCTEVEPMKAAGHYRVK